MGWWAFGCGDVRAHSAPVIAKEYDQRWKRCRTTVAIQGNMSAGVRPQCFLFTGSPRFARDESEYVKTSDSAV